MGFDGRFTLGLVFRVALLMLALMTVVWAFRTPSLLMVRVVTIGIAALAAVTLWRHVQRTNIELARFLEALRLGDFAAHFPESGGAGFGKLGAALNGTVRRLREQRGQTDAELRYLEALIDDMPVAVLTVDGGRVEPGNKAARVLFTRHSGVRPEDYSVYGATFARRLADEDASGEEMLILNLDGRAKRTLVRQAMLNRLGRRTRAVVVQPVQETLDAVEMAAQTDIVRVLTHEILNSLTPVMSLAQTTAALLGDDSVDGARIADAREAATTLARRTQGLGHFIDSYRVVAREPTVVRHPFPAVEFADEHARLFRAEWPDVILSVDCTAMTINADRALLSQLLLNLLRNAAQAARDHRSDPAVALTIAPARPVMIEVADNGPGVPAKLRQEIFLPFFTTRAKGTGVGLNLARQIAVAHGGTLEVHDAPAGGAAFRLLL
ncbi:sensor histidine kinase [Sphingomonas jeddahensis]|uniref:histidine kinase n=1 Tax=Sphingomonas jeddahensis TaxID=1915074 RepID=A0A1V2ESB5_9SPHN|nr:ATP-binding protein [Sphingomonas jeddahensis]ONF95375.1 Sensor protein FixL [Sphingomonas jeddahensis]